MSGYEKLLSWWQSQQLRNASDLKRLLRDFVPLFVYHSSLLEGWDVNLVTVKEYFQTGTVSQFTGDPKILFQLYNQKFCYEYLEERVLARDDLDTSLVLEVHRILSSGTYDEPLYFENGERPGQLKKQDYVTAVNAVGVPAREVGRELDRLAEEVSGYCGPDLLWAAANFHGRFENIHPFAAGNGSTGRVLVNYFLLTRDHPPLIFFAEDREEYFQCLTAYDKDKDSQPLTAFFRKELAKSWNL